MLARTGAENIAPKIGGRRRTQFRGVSTFEVPGRNEVSRSRDEKVVEGLVVPLFLFITTFSFSPAKKVFWFLLFENISLYTVGVLVFPSRPLFLFPSLTHTLFPLLTLRMHGSNPK